MEASRACFEKHLPFVAAFLEQWFDCQSALIKVKNLDLALECCGMATLLLGENGEVIHANGAASAILTERDGLRLHGERIACASLSDTLRLQAALSHLRADGAHEHAGLAPVLAVRRGRRRPLTIALVPVRSGAASFTDELRAIAYVLDPEQDMTRLVEPVCRLYGLSHSETKLTCALVAGDSVGVAARQIGVQEQTARSYLKHIFSKTETKRQAELVLLMLKSAIRFSSNLRLQTVA